MRVICGCVRHAELLEAVFPDRHFGFKAKGKASFDELHGLLNGDVGSGCEEEMEMIGHEDEGVDLVAAFGAVVVEEAQKEVGVCVGLEEAAALGGNGGDEIGAQFGREEVWHEARVMGVRIAE